MIRILTLLASTAVATVGKMRRKSQDHSFMCGHAFENLDGQIRALVFMDPSSAGNL